MPIMLYSHGNKKVDKISTPESRSGKIKDADLVQGLTLLTIPFNYTHIKTLIQLGAKRFAKMESVYLRRIHLMDKNVMKHIVRLHFINTDTEINFIKKHKDLDKATLNKKKEAYLKDKGLVDLSISDLTDPQGTLRKELDNTPIRFNKILSGNLPIKNKNSLYLGLPYFKVVLRAPIPIKSSMRIYQSPKDTTQESINLPIYEQL